MKKLILNLCVISVILSLTSCAKLLNSNNDDVVTLKKRLGIKIEETSSSSKPQNTTPQEVPEETEQIQIIDMGYLSTNLYNNGNFNLSQLTQVNIAKKNYIYRYKYRVNQDSNYHIILWDKETADEDYMSPLADAKITIRKGPNLTDTMIIELDGEYNSTSFPYIDNPKDYYLFVESADGSTGNAGIMIMEQSISVSNRYTEQYKLTDMPTSKNPVKITLWDDSPTTYTFDVTEGYRYYIDYRDDDYNTWYASAYFELYDTKGTYLGYASKSDKYTFIAEETGKATIQINKYSNSSSSNIELYILWIEDIPTGKEFNKWSDDKTKQYYSFAVKHNQTYKFEFKQKLDGTLTVYDYNLNIVQQFTDPDTYMNVPFITDETSNQYFIAISPNYYYTQINFTIMEEDM